MGIHGVALSDGDVAPYYLSSIPPAFLKVIFLFLSSPLSSLAFSDIFSLFRRGLWALSLSQQVTWHSHALRLDWSQH